MNDEGPTGAALVWIVVVAVIVCGFGLTIALKDSICVIIAVVIAAALISAIRRPNGT